MAITTFFFPSSSYDYHEDTQPLSSNDSFSQFAWSDASSTIQILLLSMDGQLIDSTTNLANQEYFYLFHMFYFEFHFH